MTKEKAFSILGDRAEWELKNMIKVLYIPTKIRNSLLNGMAEEDREAHFNLRWVCENYEEVKRFRGIGEKAMDFLETQFKENGMTPACGKIGNTIPIEQVKP